MELKQDKNGFVRGQAGCIVFWCAQCRSYCYGNYCNKCGSIVRYATMEDMEPFANAAECEEEEL